jgi:hypothetical protein
MKAMKLSAILAVLYYGAFVVKGQDLPTMAATGKKESPVTRVVILLKQLKDKSLQDGKVEQQIYDKYACWCEKTSKRKADDIVAAQAELRALSQQILKLKGKVAVLTAEIAELTQKIKANEDAQEEATSIRQKDNAAWMAESVEVKQALTALQAAIKVLNDATIPQKGAGLIQEKLMTQAKYAVRNVLEKLPSETGLPPARMALLSEFTSAQAGYAPQSATIQGMLVDMYTNFAEELETATNTEADQNAKYEILMAELEKSNNKMKAIREKKEQEKATAEALLADSTKAYEETEEQLEADKVFFDEMVKACHSKHKEWTIRSDLRAEEIEGIDKALEILTTDEARALFADSIKPGVEAMTKSDLESSAVEDIEQTRRYDETQTEVLDKHRSLVEFLQVDSDTSSPVAKAYNAIKTQAQKAKSVRLAALAVEIRTAKYGHFDEVIKAIDEMLKTLQEEGQADLEKQTQCQEQYQEVALTVQDLDWKIKNNKATIESLEEIIAKREEQKAASVAKKAETEKYIKDITAEREEEHEAFEQSVKDDEAAIALLTKAKEVFSKYYKKNDIKMGPIQGSVKGAFAQEEPAFNVSWEEAPDATFSKKGSNKVQSKDIVSLFDFVIEDLGEEVANARKIEANSQEEFEVERAAAEKLVADIVDKIVTLEGLIAARKEDKEQETKDMNHNNNLRDEELAYRAKITPDCNWILKAFDGRAKAREAEMNGLLSAKDFLSGQKVPEASLLDKTKGRQFDDSQLQRINFLSLSK